ncbi:MAG TPA: hypothetical protein VF789_24405 [Thermoanaerobaculia bacterium]
MDDRPIDLAALDPTLDSERWERQIAAVSALARPELARRAAAAASPALVLVGWFRPALAMAATLALCAGAALLLQLGGAAGTPAVSAEALRLPSAVDQWLGEDQPPTMAELADAVAGGQP